MLYQLERLLRLLRILGSLWGEEISSPHRFRHVSLWKRGFVSDRHELYGLGENDPAEYVSDLTRIVGGRRVNPPSLVPILANKYMFHKVLRPRFDAHLPALLGVIVRGRIHWEAAHPSENASEQTLRAMLDGPMAVVAKPIDGGGGKGIHVIRRTSGGLVHNGRPTTADQVAALLHGLNGYLIEDHLQQDPYAANIFPDSTNTLRILVMRDIATNEAFIPIAVHRFGNVRSAPTDNFSQGGFSCSIDLGVGELGAGAALSDDGKLAWHDRHPTTDDPIKGVTIPHWESTKQLILAVSDALPYLLYVGWDVVITEQGPKLIEGNHYMNPRVLQIHQPLLADDRVRAFYEHHHLSR